MDQSIDAFSIYRHTADTFPTLPEPFQREAIARCLDRLAKPLNLSAGVIRTFRVMIDKTRPSDFTNPSKEPCCYVSQAELASQLALSDRQVRNHERILCARGLIEKRTMANGARSGFHGCGIYFSAAIRLFPQLHAMVEQADAERRRRALLRGLRSTHLRHLKSALNELAAVGDGSEEAVGFAAAISAWPAAKTLHTMALTDLEAHEAEARAQAVAVTAYLEKMDHSSGPAASEFRLHLQETTQDSNLSCKESARPRTWGKHTTDDRRDAGSIDTVRLAEKRPGASRAGRIERFIKYLTPERLYFLCSEDLQAQLDFERSGRAGYTTHNFDCAVLVLLTQHGIHQSVYEDACETMGPERTTLCLILIYARADDPHRPVRSAGGYLRGLAQAHQRGTLNLTAGLIGLSERRAAERRPAGARR